jgi:hypothetical protein
MPSSHFRQTTKEWERKFAVSPEPLDLKSMDKTMLTERRRGEPEEMSSCVSYPWGAEQPKFFEELLPELAARRDCHIGNPATTALVPKKPRKSLWLTHQRRRIYSTKDVISKGFRTDRACMGPLES